MCREEIHVRKFDPQRHLAVQNVVISIPQKAPYTSPTRTMIYNLISLTHPLDSLAQGINIISVRAPSNFHRADNNELLGLFHRLNQDDLHLKHLTLAHKDATAITLTSDMLGRGTDGNFDRELCSWCAWNAACA
jgi:hypothetical protein